MEGIFGWSRFTINSKEKFLILNRKTPGCRLHYPRLRVVLSWVQ